MSKASQGWSGGTLKLARTRCRYAHVRTGPCKLCHDQRKPWHCQDSTHPEGGVYMSRRVEEELVSASRRGSPEQGREAAAGEAGCGVWDRQGGPPGEASSHHLPGCVSPFPIPPLLPIESKYIHVYTYILQMSSDMHHLQRKRISLALRGAAARCGTGKNSFAA